MALARVPVLPQRHLVALPGGSSPVEHSPSLSILRQLPSSVWAVATLRDRQLVL